MRYLYVNIVLLIGFLVVSFWGGILDMDNIIGGIIVGLIVWLFSSNAALNVKIQALKDEIKEIRSSLNDIKNKKH